MAQLALICLHFLNGTFSTYESLEIISPALYKFLGMVC